MCIEKSALSVCRSLRYGICNWLERVDGASGRTLEASAPGVFGFCPWIDFEDSIVGVFASQSGMEKAFPVYLELKALIKELGRARAVGGSSSRPSDSPAACRESSTSVPLLLRLAHIPPPAHGLFPVRALHASRIWRD